MAFANGSTRRHGDSVATNTSSKDALPDLEGKPASEQLEILANRIEVESRIRDGAEKILQLLDSGRSDGKENLRNQVEAQLAAAQAKIATLHAIVDQVRNPQPSSRQRKKATPLANGKRAIFATPLPNGKQRDEPLDKDDFKTALNQASSFVQLLASYRARYQGHTQGSPLTYIAFSAGDSPPASSSKSSPPILNDQDLDRSRTGVISAIVNILQRNLRVRYELDIVEVLRAITPALADYASKESRAAAYRLIRYLIIDGDSIDKLQPFGLDWYMVRSLARDNKHAVEKEQVIKLIRTHVDVGSSGRSPALGVGSSAVPLSDAVMRALIAAAEHPEDQFRHVILETLAEIVLIDIDLIARTEGLRVLLQCLVEGPHDLSPVLANAFLYLIDAPRTRAYLKPGSDLEIALSGITDAYGKGTGNTERMKSSATVIASMLRTWSGLLYLCMDDMRAIRSIIDTLSIPSLDTRDIILDLFFEILNIDKGEWHQDFIDGRRLTVIGLKAGFQRIVTKEPAETYSTPGIRLNLTRQYISLLLLVLIQAGLLEALFGIVEETGAPTSLSKKATLLLGEVLHVANQVLPSAIAARVQSLPRLFAMAADHDVYGDPRKMASVTLSSIDSFRRNMGRLQRPMIQGARERANSIEDPVRRNQRQVEQNKLKATIQIDDKSFQEVISKTQVMVQKDYTKWNVEALIELMEGPLLNPKRLEEAFRVLKFGKRLISFFHPFSNDRFSSLKKNIYNRRFVRLGCALLTTLVSCPEGVRFLTSEDPLLKQIGECLSQLDPYGPTTVSNPVFSKERLSETLCYGYLEMIGTLSAYPEGIELLERLKVFTAFYHIGELSDRQDLIKGIIENMDYSSGGHPRVLLSKALTSDDLEIRLFATNHLIQLIRSSSKANEWTLQLLLTQLYDPAEEVCELAAQYLEEACESMELLEMVVQMQPTLDHLGEIGHPLLLKFMSTAVGFRYLYKAGYIEREMDAWFEERNFQYVIQVEVYLAQAFASRLGDMEDTLIVPPHFYGEMAKTELGCQVLSDKGHFTDFAHFIRQHGLESEDMDLIVKLKSVLWAVGSIGAHVGGLPFLEEEGIIPSVVEIAETSLVLSVRGTAFFVLGLLSSTIQGAEMLDELEWESTITPLGETTGLCIPLDVVGFVHIPTWDCAVGPAEPSRLIPPESNIEVQILAAISNLQNTVIANEAARSLTRFKSLHRAVFSSVSLYYRALHMLSTQRYRLPVRRYILDLFDVELDPDVMTTICTLQKSLYQPPLPPPPTFLVRPNRDRSESDISGANVGLGFGIGFDMAAGERQGAAEKHGMDVLEDLEPRVNGMNGNLTPAPPTPRQANGDEDKDAEMLLERPKKGPVKLKPMTRVEGFDADGDSGE
ncbi:hypothetical protein FRB95_008091 [Tulasnella sp. JGI-2019a]|nr:hypothetical protein FRB95_008091 [Tulasnella sp. JGI-2019a]